MNRYPLAKLIQWAEEGSGGMKGRKRLQKVAYFLQRAGYPTGAEFTLHLYGPYSRDVAEACDELTSLGVLEENVDGRQYVYRLGEKGPTAIKKSEDRGVGSEGFESLAKDLISSDLWSLELGSTILFFRDSSSDWSEAVRKACEFKHVGAGSHSAVENARSLAERVYRS